MHFLVHDSYHATCPTRRFLPPPSLGPSNGRMIPRPRIKRHRPGKVPFHLLRLHAAESPSSSRSPLVVFFSNSPPELPSPPRRRSFFSEKMSSSPFFTDSHLLRRTPLRPSTNFALRSSPFIAKPPFQNRIAICQKKPRPPSKEQRAYSSPFYFPAFAACSVSVAVPQ